MYCGGDVRGLALASLVGRNSELRLLRTLARDPSIRLLTLIGPPGVGKSRLVAAIHHDLSALGDEVRLIDMARESADLGSSAAGNGPMIGLMIVDNADSEHGITATIVRLLAEHPGLRILLTSRVPLRVYGEHRFSVQPLPIPGPRPPTDLEELGQVPAVGLLLHRVAAIRPDIGLDPDNRDVVIELSNRLDGLPLAIELAAAQLRLFQPKALLTRLRAGIDLLQDTSSPTLSRHTSLSDALTWSYERMSDAQRRLLSRLARLPEYFDLDAAQSTGGIDAADLHGGMASLAELGFLRVTAKPDGEPSFSLLNTIRLFTMGRRERCDLARTEVIATEKRLTRRELQVAALVAAGLTNRQVAGQLGIAEWTAVNHVRNIMRKLDCPSRVHIASLIAQVDTQERSARTVVTTPAP